MKISSILVAATITLSSSCGLIAKDFTIKRVVHVHGSASDPTCQDDRITFNLAEDDAFNDLKGAIGKLELRKAVVRITNPKTAEESVATMANGTLGIATTQEGASVEFSTFTDVPLTTDASQELTFSVEGASAVIDAALNPPNTFYVTSHGCADAVPAFFDFQVEFTFHASM